jgi:hypothetical protein
MGIVVHHTASSTSTANDCNYMWLNSTIAPIGNIYLARDGEVIIGAAGASNTAGKGGPRTTSKGTIPLDSANSRTINIEAGNNGVGEPWPLIQQDTYVALVKALCDGYDFNPSLDVMGHCEWAPGRKIDPAGQSRWAKGSATWSMERFRSDVAGATIPEPTPEPPAPPLPKGVNDMLPMIGKYPNHGVWVVSLDGGYTHKAIRNSDWANSIVAGGAIDAKSRKLVSSWSAVPDMTSTSEVSKYLGSKTG